VLGRAASTVRANASRMRRVPGRRRADAALRVLDCLVVGAGPAGLAAALYLARFRRRFAVVDGGDSRAAWIPSSHHIPFLARDIPGPDLLARQWAHVERYGVEVVAGTVTRLEKADGRFAAEVRGRGGSDQGIEARRVLLATGAVDVDPALPDVPDAIRCGLVRYCPIYDGYEARGRKIAVIGRGEHGPGEAVFIARTYACDVTLLTLGRAQHLDARQRDAARRHGVELVEGLRVEGRIGALCVGGRERRFDALYSALGLRYRNELAIALGAECDPSGALRVDEHNQTTVEGLYAAGDAGRRVRPAR
jgi:thioredoxin reductase (NADPH)